MRRLLATLAMLVVLLGGAVASIIFLKPLLDEFEAEAAPRVTAEQVPQQPIVQAAQNEEGAAMSTVTTTTTTHGGWTVSCSQAGDPPAKTCTATFRVFNKNTNQNLLVWVFGHDREGRLLAEFLTLTDVLVQPGVVVVLDDGNPVKADYVECTSKGCKARLELTADLVGRMKAAKKARIDMTRLDGQVVQFTMDIPGIDLALRDLGA